MVYPDIYMDGDSMVFRRAQWWGIPTEVYSLRLQMDPPSPICHRLYPADHFTEPDAAQVLIALEYFNGLENPSDSVQGALAALNKLTEGV